MPAKIKKMRQEARQIFQAGLQAVDPQEAIRRHVRFKKTD